jgi:hypothetical protein
VAAVTGTRLLETLAAIMDEFDDNFEIIAP